MPTTYDVYDELGCIVVPDSVKAGSIEMVNVTNLNNIVFDITETNLDNGTMSYYTTFVTTQDLVILANIGQSSVGLESFTIPKGTKIKTYDNSQYPNYVNIAHGIANDGGYRMYNIKFSTYFGEETEKQSIGKYSVVSATVQLMDIAGGNPKNHTLSISDTIQNSGTNPWAYATIKTNVLQTPVNNTLSSKT